MFLQKTKTQATKSPASPREDDFKKATESLYKQNHELAIKNKTLSLLRELYQISVQNLAPEALAEKLAGTIRTAFEYELVAFFSYQGDKDELEPVQFMRSERWVKARTELKTTLGTLNIHGVSRGILAPVIKERTMVHIENIADFWTDESPEVLKVFQEKTHIKDLLVYPLVTENKIIGILVFALNRNYSELIQFEKDSIASFIDVIAIAMDKAYLYVELQLTNTELEAANERQTTLIHFITHQVKGFLTNSKNAFSMLLDGDYGEISDQVRGVVKQGLESGTKGVNTVMEILNAADIKTGKMAYKMASTDLRPLIESTCLDLKAIAEIRNLKLLTNIPNDSFTIEGDIEQLKHVFKNIIDNSIKYTPSGSINVSLVKKDGKILFAVKDTGVGITEEDKKRLFTEGGHGKNSQSINVESTGFGLFIVKNIVEAHHGRVWAESEGEGKGSQFYVELPSK